MKRASLNHVYRLVWNDSLNAFVAVAEIARARGKRSTRALALTAGLLIGFGGDAYALDSSALPTGGQIVAGTGSIRQSGSQMTVTQSSDRMVANWNTFNIGAQAGVQFQQPSTASVALNRVLDSNPSQIFGNLSANGQIFLVNPNGIIFGSSAQVNVGGIVASTLDIGNDNFMAGRYAFANGGAAGSIENQGTINATGGVVAFIAPQVNNTGTIRADRGSVVLAAGDKVNLDFNGDGLVTVKVDQATYNALVQNKGLIQADGGRVVMTASSANALLDTVVNNDGVVQARGLSQRDGRIVLDGGDAGVTRTAGTLDVSSTSGRGGTVMVTGDKVLIGSGTKIDATGKTGGGEVYVGGGWQGGDAAVRNATAVTLQSDATIDASAVDNGNGGKVVVWSNEVTRALGSGNIRARGGANGGDGGAVETSSKGFLQVGDAVQADAPHGRAGLWLLDPRNVTIQESGASSTLSGGTFTPAADDSIVAPSTITAALNSGTNVTITTGGTGSQAGNITVADPIAASAYDRTLTLSAHNDINVNAAISNNAGRLSVVFRSDSDNSGSGNVNFSATGSVSTNGGNFVSGNLSGESVSAGGQAFTMASGSFIDTGFGGRLYIDHNGTVTLADNSLRSKNDLYYSNDGGYMGTYNYIYVQTAGNIVTTNTDAATPDILTSSDVYLAGANIGASGAGQQIKISGTDDMVQMFRSFPNFARTLYVINSQGDSYVNEIGNQVFATVDVTIGSQANKTQNIQIMGDAGGDGTSGTGHIILNTDGSGVLKVAEGNIKTGGVPGSFNNEDPQSSVDPSVFPTSVNINAPNITFDDHAVNTGGSTFYWLYPGYRYYYPYYYSATFSANGSSSLKSSAGAANNDVPEIEGVTISLTGPTIGTSTNPVEVGGDGSTLNIFNTGGSTYVKAPNGYFGQVNMTNVKQPGTHEVLFNDGDHINYTTTANGIVVPTIDVQFDSESLVTTRSGIDTSSGQRSVSLTAYSGYVQFATDSVNTGGGTFSVNVVNGNTDRNSGKAIYAANVKDGAAEITAGDVMFVINDTTAGSIKDIEIAKGGGADGNTLLVSTYNGNVDLTELSTNHFKTLQISLNGPSTAQNIAINLAGPDDVNFSDSGSGVTIDATKVNLSSNNRNWELSTPSRTLQVDGTSIGSGNYTLTANVLKLNGDVQTDGGDIYLTGGSGIQLLKSVRIDSNADNTSNSASTGNAGSIFLNGTVSATAAGRTLTVDSSSADAGGGTIQVYSNFSNDGGAYLGGLTLDSQGSAGSNDGIIYMFASSYYLNGNFSASGNTYLYTPMTIDTEQGNTGDGGSIIFGGYSLNALPYYTYTFNTSTTAAGKNGGNVNLYATDTGNTFNASGLNITTTAGAGGTAGSIDLPAVNTTFNGSNGNQTYNGGIITLHGNLTTNWGDVSLTGDIRLDTDVTIDTWSGTSASTEGQQQTRSAGAVTIAGALSATAASRNLTIDTSTDTGGSYADTPTDTQDWAHSGGNVSIVAGNAGGAYVNDLAINTTKSGVHNSGADGSITLNGVATNGNQTYSGGATTIAGDITTNGGTIDLSGVSSVSLSGSAVTIKTDMAGGSGDAGTLILGANNLNSNVFGTVDLTIDTTADGGGASADLTLNSIGSANAPASITVVTRDLTLNGPLTTTGDIVLATRNFINNNATDTGLNAGGRYFVYASDPSDSTEGMTGYSKHYNQVYVSGSTPDYATSGNWFFYSIAPVLNVTPSSQTVTYGNNASHTASYSGFIDGDSATSAGISGSATYSVAGPTSGGFPDVGSHDVAYVSGLASVLGYTFSDNVASTSELTVTAASSGGGTSGGGAPHISDSIGTSVLGRPAGVNGTADMPNADADQAPSGSVSSGAILPGSGVDSLTALASGTLIADRTGTQHSSRAPGRGCADDQSRGSGSRCDNSGGTVSENDWR